MFGVDAVDRAPGLSSDGRLQLTGNGELGEEIAWLIGVQRHGCAVQPSAQYFVAVDDGCQRCSQLFTGDTVGQPNRFSLRQPSWLAEFVEPVRIGQQWYRPAVSVCIRRRVGSLGGSVSGCFRVNGLS